MRRGELTFDTVDDLIGARRAGRLASTASIAFAPSALGPLVELAFDSNAGRQNVLLMSNWVDESAQKDLRDALAGPQNVWLDRQRQGGFSTADAIAATVRSPAAPPSLLSTAIAALCVQTI
jgi:hypothetical protein